MSILAIKLEIFCLEEKCWILINGRMEDVGSNGYLEDFGAHRLDIQQKKFEFIIQNVKGFFYFLKYFYLKVSLKTWNLR